MVLVSTFTIASLAMDVRNSLKRTRGKSVDESGKKKMSSRALQRVMDAKEFAWITYKSKADQIVEA